MASDLIYRDATGDPAAEAQAQRNTDPQLRAALLAQGFVPLGFCQVRAANKQYIERLRQHAVGTDLPLILGLLEHGDSAEILASPDRQALACLDSYVDSMIVYLRTISASGVVLETVMRPRSAPQLIPSVVAKAQRGGGWMGRLYAYAVGSGALWVRQSVPKAGYYVDLAPIYEAGGLWEHHRRRIAALNQPIPRHESIALWIAVIRRGEALVLLEGRRMQRLVTALTVCLILLMLLLVGGMMPIILASLATSVSTALLQLALLLVLIIVLLLGGVALQGLLRTQLLPRLPSLPLQTPEQLLAAQRNESTAQAYLPQQQQH